MDDINLIDNINSWCSSFIETYQSEMSNNSEDIPDEYAQFYSEIVDNMTLDLGTSYLSLSLQTPKRETIEGSDAVSIEGEPIEGSEAEPIDEFDGSDLQNMIEYIIKQIQILPSPNKT